MVIRRSDSDFMAEKGKKGQKKKTTRGLGHKEKKGGKGEACDLSSPSLD